MQQPLRSARGFTLIETLIVSMVLAAVTGMAMIVLPAVIESTRADSGVSQLMTALRAARERAVTERRNIEIRFVGANEVECWRDEIDADGVSAGQTLVIESVFEQGIEYTRFANVAGTPDAFGEGPTAVEFTGGGPWRFTSEGQLVDINGDIVNGTIYLGRPQRPDTARAVSLFGATALLRDWTWNGAGWVE